MEVRASGVGCRNARQPTYSSLLTWCKSNLRKGLALGWTLRSLLCCLLCLESGKIAWFSNVSGSFWYFLVFPVDPLSQWQKNALIRMSHCHILYIWMHFDVFRVDRCGNGWFGLASQQPACSACLFALSFSAFLTFFLFSFARIRASGRQHVSTKRQWSSMVFHDYQLII